MPELGDFAVVQLPGRVGKLISLMEMIRRVARRQKVTTDTRFDHVMVYIGRNLIIQAEPGKNGAQLRALTDLVRSYPVIKWSTGAITLTEEQRFAICAAGRKYDGVRYSWLDYLSLTLHALHIWLPFLKHFIESSGHMICSQLADKMYEDAGVHLFADKRWPGDVDPMDMAQLIGILSTPGLQNSRLKDGA